MRIRAFPFSQAVFEFVGEHELVFIVEQNRDGQMETLLVSEGQLDSARLIGVRYFGGLSISADIIAREVRDYFVENKLARISEVTS
jgi:2-oxoglutarate ferredoxin oxidoreductase subunit alpha